MSDEILLEMNRALGRIEQKIDSNAAAFAQHAADDKVVARALFERVETLQLSHAKQKGFFSALATGGSVIGAGLGYLVERWITHR